MARTDPQLNVRIPALLRERIEGSAKESRRTLNAEVIALLEEALDAKGKRLSPKLEKELENIRSFMEVIDGHLKNLANPD